MKKYSLLRHPQTQWRPFPLQPFFLLTFLIIVVVIVVGIQLIIKRPILHGPSFLFDTIPTTIPVLLSLLWAFSAHDYKRLEAYFQLSSPTGATAEDSLLLEYPYMFMLSIPIVALRKGHYAVLLSTLILLLLTSAITPFSSGFFDAVDGRTDTRANVPYLDISPAPIFSAGFAHATYAYTFLNSALPGFMTPEYALTQWAKPSENSTWRGTSRLYESNLTCAEPTFHEFEDPGVGIIGYNVTNIDGETAFYPFQKQLNTTVPADLDAIYGNISDWMIFRVNDTISVAEEMIHISESGEKTVLGYLYILGGADPNQAFGFDMKSKNWTAIWCEPSYWYQDVEATVAMPSGEVLQAERTGEAAVLDNEITRRFGEVLLQGSLGNPVNYSDLTLPDMKDIPVRFGADTRDLPAVQGLIPNHYVGKRGDRVYEGKPQKFEAFRTFSAHVFLSFNETDILQRSWLDPEVMAEHYEQRWKMMFAFAMMQQMTDINSRDSKDVVITTFTKGWRVSLWWGRATQVALAVLAALVLALLMMSILKRGRRIELDGEPNSLVSAMGILSRSNKGVCDQFDGLEYSGGSEKLGKSLKQRGHRYKLHLMPEIGPRLDILPSGGENYGDSLDTLVGIGIDNKSTALVATTPSKTIAVSEKDRDSAARKPLLISPGSPSASKITKAAKSWIVRRPMGFLLILFFCAVIGTLIFLYIYDINHQGLPTIYPPNSFRFKVIYSYIPTVLATGIEPLLISLGTYHCMIAPYRRLSLPKRSVDSSKALSIDFDRSPPQYQILRAIRSRDTQIFALALSILVVNLLAITFGSLFFISMEERALQVPANVWDMPGTLGGFPGLAGDNILSLSASLSDTNRRRYTQDNYHYFIPPMTFNNNQSYNPKEPPLPTSSEVSPGVIEWSSLVFGSDINCTLLPQENIQSSCMSGFSGEPMDCSQLLSNYTEEFSAKVELVSPNEGPDGKGESAYYLYAGMSADILLQFTDNNGTALMLGWSELPADPQPKSEIFPLTQLPRIDTVALYCIAGLKIGSITATLDIASGIIRSSHIEFPESYQNNTLSTRMALGFNTHIAHGEGSNYWDLIDGERSLMWYNSMMARLHPDLVRNGSVNETHIPSTENLAEAFEDVYNRLFAHSLQMYSDDIFANITTKDITALYRVKEPRVRISRNMFIVSCAVIVYIIIVLVIVYWQPQGEEYYQNYLPTNIALMWTLLYASNAKEDCAGLKGNNPTERAEQLARLGNAYSLGEFVGTDGRPHWGVFRIGKGEAIVDRES